MSREDRRAILVTAVLFSSIVVMATFAASQPASSASSSPIERSAPHHIACFLGEGGKTRTYDTDPKALYSATGVYVVFRNPATGKMTRISLANCEDTWVEPAP